MPVVATVRKAAKLPAFIDVAPPPALRREHAIGQRHLTRFSRAFMRVSRSIYDPATLQALDAAMQEKIAGRMTIEEVVSVVDWFNAADPLAVKRWELLGASLDRAYTEIIDDAAQGEFEAHGWPLVLQKADIRVPINPSSIAWIRLKSASMVAEISDQQKALLREILTSGFEQGERPKAILAEIEQLVGLTLRERGWVQNREAALRAVMEDKVERARDKAKKRALLEPGVRRATDRYAESLLSKRGRRIARTETIEAYAQGLDESWAQAKDAGFIDDTVMQDWIELTASPRTCPICKGLGQSEPVPLGEPFVSDIIGEVFRPPAHPHCRCVKVLVFLEPEDVPEALAAADRDSQAARDRLVDRQRLAVDDMPTAADIPIDVALAAAEAPISTALGIPTPNVLTPVERKFFDIILGRDALRTIVELDRVLNKVPPIRSAVRIALRDSLGEEFVQLLDRLIEDPELNDRILGGLISGVGVSPEDGEALAENVRLLLTILKIKR